MAIEKPEKTRKAFIKNNKGEQKAKKAAWKIFEDTYYSNDQSSIIEKANIKKPFTPGKIYTYKYNPKTKDVLSFYDTKPIIMALGLKKDSKGLLELGINLSFLPEEIKMLLIDKVFDYSESKINKDQKGLERNGRPTVNSLGITYDRAKAVLKKTGFEFAIRSYYKERMKDIKIVNYTDWYIASMITSKSITGVSIGQIIQLYRQKK